MGGGGGQQTSTSTSTPTMDPQIKQALLDNMKVGNAVTSGILPTWVPNAAQPGANAPRFDPETRSLVYDNGASGMTGDGNGRWVNADGSDFVAPSTFTAGWTPDQLAAFDKIRNTQALSAKDLGGDVYGDLAKFVGPQVSAATVGNVDPFTAAQVADVADVASKNFTDYDFSKYANPYMSNVVDPVKQFYADEGDRAAAAAKAASRAAGGLRGSSPAIAEALSRGEISRQAGMALSPLYSDAFKTSAGLITGDAARDLQASQGNQATALSRNTTNANLTQDAAKAAYTFATQKALADASMANQAGIANQDAALRAAGIRSDAAAGMADAAKGAWDSNNITTNALLGIGDRQQALDQSKMDDIIKAINIRNALITGAVPGSTGQTTTTTGPGQGTNIGGILGGLGSLGSGIAALASL